MLKCAYGHQTNKVANYTIVLSKTSCDISTNLLLPQRCVDKIFPPANYLIAREKKDILFGH